MNYRPRWYDLVVFPLWVIVLVILGAMSMGLFSEGMTNTGWTFLWIFIILIVAVPVLRLLPTIIRWVRAPVSKGE